jgi:hypothetical protein
MGTMLTKRITYDASAEEVAAMLDDPAFREAVLERQKVLRGSVDIDGDVVTIEQVLPATGLPSFAKKFVGDEIDIVQKETWTSPTTCDVELSIPGKPGGAVGTMELVETDGRTTETFRLDVSVRIPLVGGKIESLVADIVSAAIDIEHRVGMERLSR